jgi:hypothetical protein
VAEALLSLTLACYLYALFCVDVPLFGVAPWLDDEPCDALLCPDVSF